MKYINLTKGYKAKVDDEYFEILSKFRWHFQSKGYAVTNISKTKGKKIRMHRLIIDCPKGLEVDHINGDRLDNRKENLRVCKVSENQRNRSKKEGKTSVYKGVSWDKNGWAVSIGYKGKNIYIGLFHKEQHAGLAYDIWAKDLYREFARLNFGK